MSIDYAALKTEIQTDPAVLGYSVPLAAGNDHGIADILNAVGAGATFQVNREAITTAFFLSNVSSAEYLALAQLKLLQLTPLMAAQTIDINDASTQAILIGVFGNPSTTRTNIIALLKRQGSRGEVLFGRGTAITASDVSFALRGAK